VVNAELKRKAERVLRTLLKTYGQPVWRKPLPPLDELVSTILSQNTNDSNRDRAFDALCSAFVDLDAVRDAPTEAVIAAIRPAGLANQKGPRIQQVLRQITAERGELSLHFLGELPMEEARRWLLRFKGVGPKTAAIVLLFAFRRPAFPVDTHVHRVTGRLGLCPHRMSAAGAHPHLEALFQQQHYYAAHLNLIRLGRETCRARRPRCTQCVLRSFCDYWKVSRAAVMDT
jgi:endonuclease-3